MRLTTLRFPLLLWMTLAICAAPSELTAVEEIDTTPANVTAERAFSKLKFDRPIVLTHAGDGSNRIFIASQLGAIHVLKNDQSVSKSAVYFDLSKKVKFKKEQNEEGLLGMAFHPKYKENGEFFIYYTTTEAPLTSVISRFRVSKENPDKADAKFEEEIMRISQPYWNHNGGTICFGPDGYLYIALGDGGAGNDPHMNAQNLQTILGKILRIDVDGKTPKNPDDKKSVELNYRSPKDNPFYGSGPLARPEIWAYGLRNVWRMAFDRETGELWAGDVGQNLWEEIDIIVKGGNYGWNLREATHIFGPAGSEPRADLIEPIFEYGHDIGKSITGGNVYRGPGVPELNGSYLYADYVTGKIWALKYDAASKKVTANKPISGNVLPVLSFGEDEQGETYFMTDSGTINWFQPVKAKK